MAPSKSDIQIGWFVTVTGVSVSSGEHIVLKVPNTLIGESQWMIEGGVNVYWENIQSWRPPNMSRERYIGQ
ncbi:hypothetical protein COCSADRAFT_32485 [Bipolaris sorokiniana ND90Pr]|uniref:Uncharacterized protein n=1 Tax=Cochliobolus sativus (strain ND90Pr / ATCC 201652) TaxID=665912 RepID=M2SRC7_COCSN|nr:uncharacterized protein COCSADRAFT_32485 [Bipolaris sorokiniana ND90Pr]EMD69813.1 hypothetical protein COCSADRAFT_32485 [Bipolaris sorokiniana ND90Pr]